MIINVTWIDTNKLLNKKKKKNYQQKSVALLKVKEFGSQWFQVAYYVEAGFEALFPYPFVGTWSYRFYLTIFTRSKLNDSKTHKYRLGFQHKNEVIKNQQKGQEKTHPVWVRFLWSLKTSKQPPTLAKEEAFGRSLCLFWSVLYSHQHLFILFPQLLSDPVLSAPCKIFGFWDRRQWPTHFCQIQAEWSDWEHTVNQASSPLLLEKYYEIISNRQKLTSCLLHDSYCPSFCLLWMLHLHSKNDFLLLIHWTWRNPRTSRLHHFPETRTFTGKAESKRMPPRRPIGKSRFWVPKEEEVTNTK